MKRIALTCKDPTQFFEDCRACKHYEKCDYFNKIKGKKAVKMSAPTKKDLEFIEHQTITRKQTEGGKK